MNRHCGECTLCCKLLPVPPLNKPAGVRCVHQGRAGCAVYHRPARGFPEACAVWNCRWLVDEDTAGLRRPDRSHYVIDIMPDGVGAVDNDTGERSIIPAIQVWIDPAHPEAWRDPSLLRYIEASGSCMLVRFTRTRSLAVFPPAMASDHEWHEIESKLVESPSGNLLLDQFPEE